MEEPKTPRTQAPARSLNSQHVLDEDEYTAALSEIIARDFFPSLIHLDATNNYLDALRTQDPQLIHASVRRLQDLSDATPARTPYGPGLLETPLRTPRGDGEGPSKRPRYDTSMSLDDFQARYTSEDNSSFTQILDDENRKRRDRYDWAYDAQRRVEAQRERMLEGREKMLLEMPAAAGVRETFLIEAPTPAGLITDGRESKEVKLEDGDKIEEQESKTENALVSVDKGKGKESEEQLAVDVMAPKKDTRSAGVDGWKFRARNALMFSPDADVSPYDSSTAVSVRQPDPGVIKHGNTRLPEQNDTAGARGASEPPSPTRSRIQAAISGTPYRLRSPNSRSEFPLVPTVPSPTPSELGPKAVKQLMTWGTLNGTPRVISADPDTEGLPPLSTPFHIAPPTQREALSHRLSSKASKSLRAKAELLGGGTPAAKRGAMGPPSWTPRRADAPGSLTPAARRLLDRTTLGTAAARRAEAMELAAGWDGNSARAKEKDMGRVRWTPTPSPVGRRP